MLEEQKLDLLSILLKHLEKGIIKPGSFRTTEWLEMLPLSRLEDLSQTAYTMQINPDGADSDKVADFMAVAMTLLEHEKNELYQELDEEGWGELCGRFHLLVIWVILSKKGFLKINDHISIQKDATISTSFNDEGKLIVSGNRE